MIRRALSLYDRARMEISAGNSLVIPTQAGENREILITEFDAVEGETNGRKAHPAVKRNGR